MHQYIKYLSIFFYFNKYYFIFYILYLLCCCSKKKIKYILYKKDNFLYL